MTDIDNGKGHPTNSTVKSLLEKMPSLPQGYEALPTAFFEELNDYMHMCVLKR